MAPVIELSTFRTAFVLAGENQDAITPSSLEKMNRAPPKLVLFALKTTPVGAANGALLDDGGIVTTSPCFAPLPLYKVESPVPLSAPHHGLPAERASPHGFTRSGSVNDARPATSET